MEVNVEVVRGSRADPAPARAGALVRDWRNCESKVVNVEVTGSRADDAPARAGALDREWRNCESEVNVEVSGVPARAESLVRDWRNCESIRLAWSGDSSRSCSDKNCEVNRFRLAGDLWKCVHGCEVDQV